LAPRLVRGCGDAGFGTDHDPVRPARAQVIVLLLPHSGSRTVRKS
jgi:hypothetical protein